MKKIFVLFFFLFIIVFYLKIDNTHNQKQILNSYEAFLNENKVLNNYKRSSRVILTPSLLWLKSIKPDKNLTFVNYRINHESFFCLVIDCDIPQNKIVFYPIGDNMSPVDITMNPAYSRELQKLIEDYNNGTLDNRTTEKIIKVDLTESIREKMYGAPLPVSNHVFAVAMNFPSHLKYDLAFDLNKKVRKKMKNAAPRVFFKYPPVAPPVKEISDKKSDHDSFLGAYDTIYYDHKVFIPSDDPAFPYKTTNFKLDYEAEIGVVIGRQITFESLQTMTDEDIYAAIAGYVLVNDTKARNPQVMLKIITHGKQPDHDNHYNFHDIMLNNVFGIWDNQTCRWWSYAATCNNFLSVGPFFVAANDRSSLKDIPFISARSYGKERNFFIQKYDPDILYLRQAGMITESAIYNDSMIWNLPQIVREIVRPGNPLANIAGGKITLESGDIICLGTPSGTAITSKPYPIFNLLKNVLFWVKPNQWHDMFFKGHQKEYLHPADRLFMWAEQLGFQHLDFEKK
jgi:2-keto-4-pentenoate hydratase/2-oxohepta-3-ene-1,7-dioic acid hydratase in catechol pathway